MFITIPSVCPACRFAEEYHKLALALGGRYRKRTVPLQCAGQAADLAQQRRMLL